MLIRFDSRYRPSLSLLLLLVLFGALWVAGGASRADAAGQAVVRGVAFGALVVAALFAPRPAFPGVGSIALLLLGAVLLAAVQLVPLPPAVWQALPGRGLFSEAAAAAGQVQPWRPLAIVPGAAFNALASLVVPVTALTLLAGLEERERGWLPGLVLLMISASAIVGLLQFSGAYFLNPLIDGTPGQIGGIFSNRNHFALLLALGCLLAPVWAFMGGTGPGWRVPVAFGLTLLFSLMILGTGSRAGLVLAVVAIGFGLMIVRHGIRRELDHAPRWVLPALIVAIVGVLAIFVLISVASDRAASIGRLLQADPGQDMRGRGLPVVLDMIRAYFPAGSGLGSFDAVFRVDEPFDLLKRTYFNHAHNDFLEVLLDAGALGGILLVAALGWWGVASFRAWRAGARSRYMLPKLGSAALLLILLASAVDYPARTPTIMALAIVAAVWLSGARREPALPSADQSL